MEWEQTQEGTEVMFVRDNKAKKRYWQRIRDIFNDEMTSEEKLNAMVMLSDNYYEEQ